MLNPNKAPANYRTEYIHEDHIMAVFPGEYFPAAVGSPVWITHADGENLVGTVESCEIVIQEVLDAFEMSSGIEQYYQTLVVKIFVKKRQEILRLSGKTVEIPIHPEDDSGG